MGAPVGIQNVRCPMEEEDSCESEVGKREKVASPNLEEIENPPGESHNVIRDNPIQFNGKLKNLRAFLESIKESVESCRDIFNGAMDQALNVIFKPTDKDNDRIHVLRSFNWLINDYKIRSDKGTTQIEQPSYIFVDKYLMNANSIICARFDWRRETRHMRELAFNYVAATMEHEWTWKENYYFIEGFKVVKSIVYPRMFNEKLVFIDYYLHEGKLGGKKTPTLQLVERILKSLCQNHLLMNTITLWALETIKENRRHYELHDEALYLFKAGGAIHMLAVMAPHLISSGRKLDDIYELLLNLIPENLSLGEDDIGILLPHLELIQGFANIHFTQEQFEKLTNYLMDLHRGCLKKYTCGYACLTLRLLLESPESEVKLKCIKPRMIKFGRRLMNISLQKTTPNSDIYTRDIDDLYMTIAQLFYS